MYLKFATELLPISDSTLKSYEMRNRLVRLDVLCRLSQIYNMTIGMMFHR